MTTYRPLIVNAAANQIQEIGNSDILTVPNLTVQGTINGNTIGYASSVEILPDSTNTTRYITFVDVASGISTLRTNTAFVFNPSTNSVGIGSTTPQGALDIKVGSASTVVINYGYSQIISSSNSGFTFTNNSVGSYNTTNFTGSRNNIFGSFNNGGISGSENLLIGTFNNYSNNGNVSGNTNILIGSHNWYGNNSQSGTENILIGDSNNYGGNSSGSYNTLIGSQIFYQNSFAGNYNVVMGYEAAYTTTNIGVNASDNVIFGRNAAGFGSITSASNNVAIGSSSLGSISTGKRNVALGSSAGIGITTGNENVVIGFKQTTPILSGSNQLVIGAGNTAWINGNSSYNVGIGTTNPQAKLHVQGDARVGSGPSEGVILTSTNGTKYRLIVSDAGVLSTTVVT